MIEHTKQPLTWTDASAAHEGSDLSLVRRFREVPHPCDDPSCPGNVNRRKLAALCELVEASAKLSCAIARGDPPWVAHNELIVNRVYRAIAAVIDIDAAAVTAKRVAD